MSSTKSTKALVIGAGPGGYACALRLAHHGIKPILVDKGALGGTCLNVGCIPSKAVITAAKLADKARHADVMGIHIGEVSVDLAALMKWKDDVVKKLVGGVAQLCKGTGVEVVAGRAAFRNKGEVEVFTDSGTVVIQAENIVIATGSVPIEIPGFKPDNERVVDSTGALALPALPGRMVVIGGGYIGLELGIAYAKLGTKVTVVEAMNQILPGFDPEIAKLLDRKLKKLGIDVFLKAKAKGWSEGNGEAIVGIEVDGQAKTLACDKILVTVGRRPFSTGLNLEGAGLKLNDRGFLAVDDKMRTAVAGIYAIGDVVGNPMLAHKAYREADVAADVIAGLPAAFDARCIPAVVFTDPEIATCGVMEHEAKAQGLDYKVGKFPFAALGRAMTAAETDGFCKAIIDARTEELLGVAVIGPNASDLIAEAALAIEMGAVFDDVALTIHAHPTLPEALKEAVLAAKGEALHALPSPAAVKG
ncbi:MAG: dihydrolipoyl dehydrogenase [Candidatus Sericytochromatia bacterium]|uniref:Dihydrolipoyl dehydrogenase n=1 Tax=Candidatus Tanganyikabacteria bacterium TaxID=2961651 RepID=A0A938BM50_9BACT|nr:dihydrolipoyl dehydrogenase [Candidatus Tanganyikabacteria bacterium]